MLLDHFHPPLSQIRHWTGFHSHWASVITADLNQLLPKEWFAEPNVHWGVEVDVGTYEEQEPQRATSAEGDETAVWQRRTDGRGQERWWAAPW